jgi:hypothetical protein
MRRVAILVAAWAVLVWLVLGGAAWVERTLALPPLFRTGLVALLLLGLGLGVPLAWRLPDVGTEPPESEPGDPGGGPG